MADLRTLQPWLQPWARWIYDYGRSFNPKLVVTSARRDSMKQQRLRADYLSGKSKIYAAPAGTSRHEFGEAFDMASVGVDPFDDWSLPWLGYYWQYYGGLYGGSSDPVHFGVRGA